MRLPSTIAQVVLSVLVMAVYLPMLYDTAFSERVEKTHLFFSPVKEAFIYKEKIVGDIPEGARKKAEDHHAELAYADQDGTYYTRTDFEKLLPFIFYKNMELWGLLPITLRGETFDKQTIRKNRRVMELKAREIGDRRSLAPLWPLIEGKSGRVRLVFPEDRFRMTDTGMEFVNADDNAIDRELTDKFSRALSKAGFVFPARSVNGKFTVLKPFDEGVFIVDAGWSVFHVKRVEGNPVVVKTPIDPALKTRHIKVSENKAKQDYGLLLDGNGGLHILTCDDYGLIPLPLKGYNPDAMDFKLIRNPLFKTAVYSDEDTIRAVAMDKAFTPFAEYEHRMSRSTETAADLWRNILFPFTLSFGEDHGDFLRIKARLGGPASLIGMAACLLVYVLWRRLRRGAAPHPGAAALTALTGIFGLITTLFLLED